MPRVSSKTSRRIVFSPQFSTRTTSHGQARNLARKLVAHQLEVLAPPSPCFIDKTRRARQLKHLGAIVDCGVHIATDDENPTLASSFRAVDYKR